MILDLNDPSAATARECDVAIVGAGIAGSILACELARAGKRVILLESGGMTQPGETHPLNRVEQAASEYRGAEHGRFRCLGGTSTRWGGALIPLQPEDIEPAWPIRYVELAAHLQRAEEIFSLPGTPYESDETERALDSGVAAEFRIRAAKWPAFRRRNVAHLLDVPLKSEKGPCVWLNSTLTDITLDDDGRINRLRARGAHGAVELAAREVVLAAGAIESTRLMLKLDADHDHRLSKGSDSLGRYFHDHLSAPVARIVSPRHRDLNRFTGFRFEQSALRNVRFELNGARRARDALPGAFLHVACTSRHPGGFDALREIYRALQRRAVPAAAHMRQLALHAGWFSRAAWARFIEHRVLPPDDGDYEVHLVTEQVPVAENRITLSANERDAFDVPLARIDWRVTEHDVRNTGAVLDAFANYWSGRPREVLGELEAYPRERWEDALTRGGGIFHPGGSLRMAASRENGVVDADLRVFGIPNLRVLSTAVFPNGGSANPTMTLILLALRAAAQLRAVVR